MTPVSELVNGITKPHLAKSFKEFQDKLEYIQKSPPWNANIIYRGHSKAEYRLASTLERLLGDLNNPDRGPSGDRFKMRGHKDAEDWLVREFRRAVHHHELVTLDKNDRLGWLALMQHHGTPTRLLDWTLSPYIALFFAVQPGNSECAVYACNPSILDDLCRDIGTVIDIDTITREKLGALMPSLVTANSDLEQRHDTINELLNDALAGHLPLAVAIRPFHLNLRVVAQQGVFLVPLSGELPFEQCLFQSANRSRIPFPLLHKITIQDHNRNDILRELQRMNITQQSLFPGLDGYARSLADQYELSNKGFYL